MLNTGLEFQKKFIDDHLSQWIPTFCAKMARESNDSFYGQMAKLTREFIEFDKKQVNGILSGIVGEPNEE